MELSLPFLKELQNRLKVGNRLSTHLNAIPKKSNYKLDFSLLSAIDQDMPDAFLQSLLSKGKFSFEISWKDKEIDLFNLSVGEHKKFSAISKIFTSLLNQVTVIKEERGVETFGFGFPLLIRKNRADKKLTVAPLIIWKLKLERSKKNDAWIISRETDSDIYLNEVLVNHLQADAEIFLDPLSADFVGDGIITKDELYEVCKGVLKKTNISKIANIDDNLNKLFSEIKPILSEDEYEDLPLNDTNSFLTYSGLFSYFEIQKQNIIKDYDALISLEGAEIIQDHTEGNVFQSLTSIPTDPSQQSFLNSIHKIRHLVIQGPPGTGKSQTLTALLVNAMENGKKTIVVCEKHTALDVLHKSLDRVGLSSHVALINDASEKRQAIVSAVRNRVTNLGHLSTTYANGPFKYSAQLKNIKTVIDKINRQHKTLDAELLALYKWSDIVGKYLKNHRFNDAQKVAFPLTIPFAFTYEEYDEWRSVLQKGQQLYTDYTSYGEITFLTRESFLNKSFYSFDEELETAFEAYDQSLNKISELKNQLYNQFIVQRNKKLYAQKDIIDASLSKLRTNVLNVYALISTHKVKFIENNKADFDRDISRFSDIVTNLQNIWNRNQKKPDFLNEQTQRSFGFKIGSWFSSEKKSILSDVKHFNELYDALSFSVSTSPNFDGLEPAQDISLNVKSFNNFNSSYTSAISEFNRKSEKGFNSLDLPYLSTLTDSAGIIGHLQLLLQRNFLSVNQKKLLDDLISDINNFFASQELNWLELTSALKHSPDFKFDFEYNSKLVDNEKQISKIEKRVATVVESIQSKIDFEFLNADILKDKDLFSHLEVYSELVEAYDSLTAKIVSDNYIANCTLPVNINAFINYVQNLITQKRALYDEQPNALSNSYKWINFYEGLNESQKLVITNVKSEENWEYAFLMFYFDRLLKKNASDDLPTDEFLLNDYKKKIINVEETQISSINDFWYKKQRDSVSRFNSISPYFQINNLYNLRGSAGNRRYSLRNLIEHNCDLFTDLHPIILTTPDVASTLFREKNGYFDFVVFDEASQLRLEDNLPAMLKGKQIIIAGDEHQMPPSSFFEKKLIAGLLDSEEEDEEESFAMKDKSSVEAGLLSSISLLDAVSELNFKNQYLNFHYRSRHPFLIDFSNYAFYGQKLVPLPVAVEYTPIKYIHVGGIYDSNTNDKEADVVMSILKNNIHKDSQGKYPTVGIATFNIKQRDLIKTKILELKKVDRDRDFIKKIERLESDGLFIKNLENIQGDERDVIIMSTTYGPDEDGKFHQRFGQLNNSKGYKLLNVIVTRAKYKNYIVTSIPEEHIGNYQSYLKTAGTNHGKAPIYAYLAYAKAVSDKNEDLRKSVLQALALNNPASSESISAIEDKLESIFEEEVYTRIRETELRDFIELQYKVGGFRIDMVIDLKMPGIPKIALECDGAKFHSSEEAYLYDFHRQKILESHGFIFHRIWGTNWWRNPDYEIQKLLEFVNNVKSPKSGDLFANSEISEDIYSDDIIISNEESELLIQSESPSVENIDFLYPEEDIIVVDTELQKTEIGSYVKLNYINQNQVLQFKIVSPKTAAKEPNLEIREVLFNSPLGKAVLGKSVGDSASIEGLDNIVEILEIS